MLLLHQGTKAQDAIDVKNARVNALDSVAKRLLPNMEHITQVEYTTWQAMTEPRINEMLAQMQSLATDITELEKTPFRSKDGRSALWFVVGICGLYLFLFSIRFALK
jgi:hypothetical protein